MIDYSRLAFPKGLPRVVARLRRDREEAAEERACRLAVNARDRHRCFFPGCRTLASERHHVRPRSLGGRWETANIVSSCAKHHRWFHGGLIQITGNPDQGPVRVRLTTLGEQAGIVIPARN